MRPPNFFLRDYRMIEFRNDIVGRMRPIPGIRHPFSGWCVTGIELENSMLVNAGKLLDAMRLRQHLQREGIASPPEDVKSATKALVDELSQIDGSENVDVVIADETVSYVRETDGEVLAEIRLDDTRMPEYTWGDAVIVVENQAPGSVCGVTKTADGFAYTVEFIDGSDALIPEQELAPYTD